MSILNRTPTQRPVTFKTSDPATAIRVSIPLIEARQSSFEPIEPAELRGWIMDRFPALSPEQIDQVHEQVRCAL